MINSPKVLLVDLGLGNLGSVEAGLRRHECNVQRYKEPPDFSLSDSFTHLILPGVGSFAYGMEVITSSGWASWLGQHWSSERPLLGICLGMQLLASEGLEGSLSGEPIPGLGFIPGSVVRMSTISSLPLPHIGWNSVKWNENQSILAKQIPQNGDFYFVHSYKFELSYEDLHLAAFTGYGSSFPSVVRNGMYFGVQFHPEKSQRLGRQLISNFLAIHSC